MREPFRIAENDSYEPLESGLSHYRNAGQQQNLVGNENRTRQCSDPRRRCPGMRRAG
jgi:hypothetical protein